MDSGMKSEVTDYLSRQLSAADRLRHSDYAYDAVASIHLVTWNAGGAAGGGGQARAALLSDSKWIPGLMSISSWGDERLQIAALNTIKNILAGVPADQISDAERLNIVGQLAAKIHSLLWKE